MPGIAFWTCLCYPELTLPCKSLLPWQREASGNLLKGWNRTAVNRAESTSGKQTASDLAKNFREQALQIINMSLEEARTQHPLDVPRIFDYDRPTLGGTVPLQLYRAVRLLAFREVLGSKISAAILNVSGRSVARKMEIRSIPELVRTLEDLSVGSPRIEEQTDDHLILTSTECATCSGVPNIGEALCCFEAGFIAGALEGVLEKPVKVVETQCWGLGDKICRWEARRAPKRGRADDGAHIDTVELVMTLAGKAALAMENGIAIRQKNRQLREAFHQLRESERLKKDLTDMVVHDMRVPLTAVMGSVETVTDMMESKLSRQEKELLNMALVSGQALLHMISDLLDISKLEEHKLTLKKSPAKAGRLVEEAIGQVEILTRRKNLKVKVDVASDLPDVPMDTNRIARVLMNLLGNAAHHTSRGGNISVTAAGEPDGKAVRISISDTGEGIPKEYHRKIFDKFVQVEPSKSRKRLSSGLGLTFCKLVIEAHGGEIRVESEPGAGSTFTFTLPVK